MEENKNNNKDNTYNLFEYKLLVDTADQYQNTQDFYSAIEYYTAAIEMDIKNAELYHKRGWSKAHIGDIKGELEDWTKAIECDPNIAQYYADRAIAKVTLMDYTGAIEDAEQAIKIDPEQKELLEPVISNIYKKIEIPEMVDEKTGNMPDKEVQEEMENLGSNRRDFIKQITTVGMATMTGALLTSCTSKTLEGGKKNVKWGMIIDLKKCVGCKACTVACKVENHTPPGVAYNVVLEEETGVFPHNKKTFTPRPCMQCENPSCTTVCPVSATYQREDGITVVDYDVCIGCKYCIAACPYGARSFDFGHNYGEEDVYPWEGQPSPEYGQNRVRKDHASPEGNVRKCTFCLHRIYNGTGPACATTCMGNAIYFGNLADPDAECMVHGVNLQNLLATRSYMRLKEETGNAPRVYYLT